MKRAVAFCQNIKISKQITNVFNVASDTYISELPAEKRDSMQMINSKHIDGTMDATQRNELLAWLKDEPESNECRVLTNVRCLSEGVDVPTLDAVLFLSARNSQVDVVQSVGRVMRKAPNKKYGYIIIPIVVPSTIEADKALDDNDRYKVVWTVLNALRAHDDRFNAIVNKIELNKKKPAQILVGRPDTTFDKDGRPINNDNESNESAQKVAEQLNIQFEQLQSVVFARMVQKVGDRRYWEQWAKSVADIATRQTIRIAKLIKDNPQHQKGFDNFLAGLHHNINPSITQPEAIEMLSQHIITKPVFDALFEKYSFVQNNSISQSMQKILDLLDGQAIEKDVEILQKFYDSVKNRASDIDNAEGRQRIIIELYDKFFKTAFPKMVEKLGIVYTPIEVVDFIIHSVNDILKKEFDRNLSDENIHILDPFTGTGTFITRLLQSGLIDKNDLKRKYISEIHANEIVLLAYYIAAVNIESAYHDIIGTDEYHSYEGICLTDTFQLSETDVDNKLSSDVFLKNTERVQKQKNAPLKVIFGNPPYSVGQKSANDNAQNQSYPKLDQRIAYTYAKLSSAGLNKSLYDAYIKAFRWSTDRLDKTGGIIAFVSNGAWLDGNSTDGFRKSIEKEFTSIYVFNLRGNQRTSGELSRREGGKIFGSGSRTPIAITLLVKNPDVKTEKATIHYHDIGEYLTREEKLKIVSDFKSFGNEKTPLKSLIPNEHGDWLSMRNASFENYIPLASEKKFDSKSKSFFSISGPGISSGRDFWVYNFSKNSVVQNTKKTIQFFNAQCAKLKTARALNINVKTDAVIESDLKQISWTVNLKNDLEKYKIHNIETYNPSKSNYRPFVKHQLLFDKTLIERPGLNRIFFPSIDNKNLVIALSGVGSSKDFATLISDKLTSYDLLEKTQCFPLYYYDEIDNTNNNLFDSTKEKEYVRRDAVSDFILDRAKKQYGKNVTKEDIFYYVYGFLHSTHYREKFANDLKKMLPRIPLIEVVKDFWAYSKAGRKLADLHINYESVAPHPDVAVIFNPLSISDSLKQLPQDEIDYINYKVQKMRFPKKDLKETIIYNNQVTIDFIPEKAYQYVVNGKSAIEWIMERYQITTHKESGITNDPNDWSKEVGNPKYILNLLLSIINVSVQTVDIVNNLPKVDFNTQTKED
jgi:predicted helicase